MTTKEEKRTIYVSDDGKEYLTEKECKIRDYFVKNIMQDIRFYRLIPSAHYLEKYKLGRIYNIAVYAEKYHYEIAMRFALEIYEKIFGVENNNEFINFKLKESSQDEFEDTIAVNYPRAEINVKIGQILLSKEQIQGFPEKWDYIENFN